LVKNYIFRDLHFTNLNIYVDYINRKQIKHTKKRVTRSTQLPKIIGTNISKPFDIIFFSIEKYFITFINDYSCIKIPKTSKVVLLKIIGTNEGF